MVVDDTHLNCYNCMYQVAFQTTWEAFEMWIKSSRYIDYLFVQ